MKILCIDQCSGASGDMINAALFGIHRDRTFVEDVVASLDVHGLKVVVREELVSGIGAWKFANL